jgi:hypothetical protein
MARSPVSLALTALALGLCACGGEEDRAWTVAQAESVTTVRGMPVRVRECRPLGDASGDGGARRYERFRCVAGARLPGEPFDSVAVLYELRPTGESDHELRRVRFIGGPGIP